MIDGYIIVGPGWTDDIQMEMGMRTLARTPVGAWRLHLGYDSWLSIDRPILVQRWWDRGYRVRPVRLTWRGEN